MSSDEFENQITVLRKAVQAKNELSRQTRVNQIVEHLSVVFEGEAPTPGETLTAILRIIRSLAALDRNFRDTWEARWRKDYYAFATNYWRGIRERLTDDVAQEADRVLGMDERIFFKETRFPLTGLENSLRQHRSPEHRPWINAKREFSQDNRQREGSFARELIRSATDLPECVRTELLRSIENESGITNEAGRWISAANLVAEAPGYYLNDLYLGNRKMSWGEILRTVQAHPADFAQSMIAFPSEQRAAEELAKHDAWKKNAAPHTDATTCYLMIGGVRYMRTEHVETVLRFFEAIGIDPFKNSERVFARRGLHSYPAVYWIYPSNSFTAIILLSGCASYDCVIMFKGVVDEAIAWIVQHFEPITLNIDDNVSIDEAFARLEDAPPDTNLSFFEQLDPRIRSYAVKRRMQ